MNLREGLAAVRWGMRPDEVLAAVPGSEKSPGYVGRDPKTGETLVGDSQSGDDARNGRVETQAPHRACPPDRPMARGLASSRY